MKRVWMALTAAAMAAGCGPARMEATEAAHVLEHYASGAPGAVDVCAPGGRDTLRSAVRAYGAAMAEGGQAWPNLPADDEASSEQLNSVELSVLISLAAGFVHASDLQPGARGRAQRLVLAHLGGVIDFRGAAVRACEAAAALQRAASHYMREMERLRIVTAQAERNRGGRAPADRIRNQQRRVEAARADMEAAARAVQARLAS